MHVGSPSGSRPTTRLRFSDGGVIGDDAKAIVRLANHHRHGSLLGMTSLPDLIRSPVGMHQLWLARSVIQASASVAATRAAGG